MPELADVVPAFFGPEALPTTLAILCQQNAEAPDQIASTLICALTCPLQIHLTAVGWQPFRGKALTIPYPSMTARQRQTLLALLQGEHVLHTYEHALVIRRSAAPVRLATLDVLEALCSTVLASPAYPDRRLRIALCNILLQRVQASVPLDKGTQAKLNARLFEPRPEAA
jgi:hypothetical protein